MAFAYTRPIARATAVANQQTDLGTVPEGYVWIVRDVCIYNGSVSELTYYLQVVTGSSIFTLFTGQLATGSSEHLELRQALVETNQLVFFSTQGSQISVTGYILSAA